MSLLIELSQLRINSPITSYPSFFSLIAATLLSTPPLIQITTFFIISPKLIISLYIKISYIFGNKKYSYSIEIIITPILNKYMIEYLVKQFLKSKFFLNNIESNNLNDIFKEDII